MTLVFHQDECAVFVLGLSVYKDQAIDVLYDDGVRVNALPCACTRFFVTPKGGLIMLFGNYVCNYLN